MTHENPRKPERDDARSVFDSTASPPGELVIVTYADPDEPDRAYTPSAFARTVARAVANGTLRMSGMDGMDGITVWRFDPDKNDWIQP